MTEPTQDQATSLAEVATADVDSKTVITIQPHDHDVLCGRGGFTNHHKGNLWYRRLISCNRPLYRNSPKHTKLLVSKAIVHAVVSQIPSGRFLERDKKTGEWRPVPYKRAVDKTSQALREKDRIDEKLPNADADPFAGSQSTCLTELAKAAVERARGMPDYSDEVPGNRAERCAGKAPPVREEQTPDAVASTLLARRAISEGVRYQMSSYAVQALQSAGGIPKNWNYPNAGPTAAAAPGFGVARANNPLAGTVPPSGFANMGGMPGFPQQPPLQQALALSLASKQQVMPPAVMPPAGMPPAAMPPAVAAMKPAAITKRARQASNATTPGSSRLGRNHRKLPTKKRRKVEEPVPPPTEPLQDRASSMFRFFQENELLPSQNLEADNNSTPSVAASQSSNSEDDTPLTVLMQVATSELDRKGDKKKIVTPLEFQNSESDNSISCAPALGRMHSSNVPALERMDSISGAPALGRMNSSSSAAPALERMDSISGAPALTRMTSQISDWLRTPFWPAEMRSHSSSSSMTPHAAAMPPPPLAPAVSSTLLKLHPGKLFSALFERNQSQGNNPQPQLQQQQHGKSTGGSLLDDYEESAMETKLRTVLPNS